MINREWLQSLDELESGLFKIWKKLEEKYGPYDADVDTLNECIDKIRNFRPAVANVQEARHGRWIPSRDKDGTYEEVCSECGYIEKYNIDPNNDKHPNYCSNCGMPMGGENKGGE